MVVVVSQTHVHHWNREAGGEVGARRSEVVKVNGTLNGVGGGAGAIEVVTLPSCA